MPLRVTGDQKPTGPLSQAWRAVVGCYASKPLLVAVLLLNGGFFFRSGTPFDQHPLAISGARELVFGICFLFAMGAVAGAIRNRQIFAGDFLLIFVVLAFPITSAILANLKFGQPIVFGLLEERRILGLFAYFFIIFAYRFSRATPDDLIGAIHFTALAYLLLGLILQTGILGDLAARDVPDLDPRKYRMSGGIDVYAISAVIAAAMIIWRNEWRHVVPILAGFAGLVLISQTRATIGVVLATILVIFAFRRSVLAAALASISGACVLLWGGSESGVSGISRIGEVIIRLNTVDTIMDELRANGWVGLGSLSLQWEDGFARVYGKYFFLSDVGLIGEFYRFGLVLIIICIAMVTAVYFYFDRCRDSKGRIICSSLIVYNVLNAPGASLIAYGGLEWSLFLALATAYAQIPTHASYERLTLKQLEARLFPSASQAKQTVVFEAPPS